MPKSQDKPFNWDRENAESALSLVFEGRWTQDEIAEKCHIAARTLRDWMKHPSFQSRLETMRADFASQLRGIAYADKSQRIIGLSQMAESARREYEERPWLKEIRPTQDGEIVNEAFNRDAHAAFRDALSDIAAELGARKNVTELSGALDLTGAVSFYLPQPEQPPDERPNDSANESASD